ncbi:heparin lyase I family protein [Bradyrhizobium sp. BWA-3-5]|uniref:heparin lyase I family protein n=1 Tax=Bradyrhizobium sp. BWA-3-5 TaxID=3080013 RepID=UPI00293EBE46|nr:heparin lyase I family protein [Bradyrhizobium sp. BWA-3-5]WOH69763.1 heparin lyase I family protein [Bradyrhizobium sp. BWA-3-5]
MRSLIDTMANPEMRISPEKKHGRLLWSIVRRLRISPRFMCGLLMLLIDGLNPMTMTFAIAADGKAISPHQPNELPAKITRMLFPANGSTVHIGDSVYVVQNANQSWSLQESDTDTLRFELRSGDHWSSPGYSDPTSAERSETGGDTLYPAGTHINVSYDFMIEPGATNTAKWIVLGQMHEESAGYSPPFAVELVNGDHMAIDIGTGKEVYLYTDPNPIQRGRYYSMNIQVKFDNNGNGFLRVWRDGVQIVDYHGSIGTGAATYWKQGIYRSAAPETMTVHFRRLKITAVAW